MLEGPPHGSVLFVRAGGRICALPLENVVETMRPLAVAPLAGVPPFVRGVAVVRGAPAPVVHLDGLLGGDAARAPARFVLLRCGGRAAVVAVDAVAGVGALDGAEEPAAPLLEAASHGAIEAVAALGGEVLLVLRAAWLVPPSAWRALDGAAAR